ncbi:hypothetical protein ACM61V_16235 [Sphingomonas sp. TX0543]|jgi:hypothetical protein|uniref:hypothetical protein n=1 Tax=unclassified Sphingomonas TaxID=196159 RepID=UPI00258031FC|nr:hypothetical protein [Sphingomonas sp. 66-10]
MAKRSQGGCVMQLTQLFPIRRVKRNWSALSRTLSKQQRLARWIELLNRRPTEMLRLLPPTWCLTLAEQKTLLTSGTAIEIAYLDPILRLNGLRDPHLTDAMAFFGLSSKDADRIFGKSRYNEERSAGDTVIRIQNVANKRREHRLVCSFLLASGLIAAALSFLF